MHPFRFSVAVLLAAFAVAGCDNASVDAEPDPAATTTAEDAAAVSIANALALDSGGALDVLAAAAGVGGDDAASHGSGHGCTAERSYDEATVTWTGVVSCEHGRPDGPFYALYSRTRTYQFLDRTGTPQPSPEGAQTLHFAVVDGEGIRRRPTFSHELLDIGADLVVDDLQADLVTINGTHHRSATDTLTTRRTQHTLVYDLAMTFIDVRGPHGAHLRDQWPRAVSGTIEGTYDAVRTFTTPNGTREQEIHRDFVITFGDGGRDTDRAVIRIGDRSFEADLVTGEVDGMD